jgi:hypothetical protein
VKRRRSKGGVVELEINGVAVKIPCGADGGIIAELIEVPNAQR